MKPLRAIILPCALTVAACADSPVALEPPAAVGPEAANVVEGHLTGAEWPPDTLVKIPLYVRSYRWKDRDSVRVVAGDHNLQLYRSNATMYTHDRMALWRRTLSLDPPADTASRQRPAKGEDGVWFESWLPWFGVWWRHEIVHTDFPNTDFAHLASGWYSMSEVSAVDTTAIGFRAFYYREEPAIFIVKTRRDGLWTEKVKMWTPIDSIRTRPMSGYVGTSWCRFTPVPEKTNAEGVTWEIDPSCPQEPWGEAAPVGSG